MAAPGQLQLHNRYDFLSLSHLGGTWSLLDDGVPVAGGGLGPLSAGPGETETLSLGELPKCRGGAVLDVSLRARVAAPWAVAGHEAAWAQFVLPALAPGLGERARAGGPRPAAGDQAVLVEERPGALVLSAAGSEARFEGGWLVSLTGNGAELVDRKPRLELWRAPVDNDSHGIWTEVVAAKWTTAGLDRLEHRVEAVESTSEGSAAKVLVVTRVAPAGLGWSVRCTYRYRLDGRGRLALEVDGVPEGAVPATFARVGLAMALVPAMREFAWYGLGPQETYPDTKSAGRLGRYRATLEELETPYVVPQENGHRSDVRWCQVSDGHNGLLVTGAPLFGFSAHPWSTAALAAARHRDELVAEARTWLHLDHRQYGLGSATCGPAPLDQYILRSEPFRFALGFWPLPVLAADPGPAARELGAVLGEG
jgi:beta-galactosidase